MIAVLFFSMVLVLLLPSTSHAYIDPGVGSMMVQVIMGVVIGGIIWFRDAIKNLFKRKK